MVFSLRILSKSISIFINASIESKSKFTDKSPNFWVSIIAWLIATDGVDNKRSSKLEIESGSLALSLIAFLAINTNILINGKKIITEITLIKRNA